LLETFLNLPSLFKVLFLPLLVGRSIVQ